MERRTTAASCCLKQAFAGFFAAFSQQPLKLTHSDFESCQSCPTSVWLSRTGTCAAVEHAKAVCVMVPKELGSDHPVVLLHNSQVALVEVPPEPGLAPFLLKEARRDMPHNVDLQKQELP